MKAKAVTTKALSAKGSSGQTLPAIGEARLARAAAAAMRTAIRLAGGNEVCFVASLDEEGIIANARPVARGDVRIQIPVTGQAYTPQEISAMILSKLKTDAEAYLGEKVTQAVIQLKVWG